VKADPCPGSLSTSIVPVDRPLVLDGLAGERALVARDRADRVVGAPALVDRHPDRRQVLVAGELTRDGGHLEIRVRRPDEGRQLVEQHAERALLDVREWHG